MDKKTEKKIQKILIRLAGVLFLVAICISLAGYIIGKQNEKKIKELANARLPLINEKVEEIIKINSSITDIDTYFEYKGINFVEVYVTDSWFDTEDINKKRFAQSIREDIKNILVYYGFAKSDDRLGIYIKDSYGITLAESNMYDEIKLKE